MFGLTVVTAPASEPITLEEAKENLRFSGDYESDRIRSLIKAARIYCERATGKAFITQTLKLTLDAFPGYRDDGVLRLPRPPLQTVTHIKYDDYANVEQTLSASLYTVDAASEPGRIGLAYGQIWPDLYEELGSVRVTYVAGYGLAAAVPDTIKQAMHLLIAHWFENREAVGNAGGTVALACESLLGCEDSGAMVGTYG